MPESLAQTLAARGPLIGATVALGAQCALLAAATIAEQSPFSEYLGHARRCVELDDCPASGGRTGGLPLFHGALWRRVLSVALTAGAALGLVQHLILAGWVLSIAVTAALLARYLGWRAAVVGIGFYFPVVLVTTDITIFTYTNLLPLPFALYYFGMALLAERGSLTAAVVASAALATAVSAELGGIVMVPFHFVLVALLAPHRPRALAVCGLGFAVPFWLDSRDTALQILRQVPTARFAVALAICAALVAAAAPLARRVLAGPPLALAERLRLVMTACLVYATGTIWLGNLLLSGGVPAPRYFSPAVFPFLFLLAERAARLDRRRTAALAALASLAMAVLWWAPRGVELLQLQVAAAVTLAALAAVVRLARRGRAGLAPPRSLAVPVAIAACALVIAAGEVLVDARRGPPQALGTADADPLITALYRAGYRYPQLLTTLQGPAVDDMVSLVTERDPDLFVEPAPPLGEPVDSLLVIRVPAPLAARTAGVVAAAPSSGGRSLIAVRGPPPFLRWGHMRRCAPAGAGFACAAPRRDEPLPRNWPYVRFGPAAPDAAAGPVGELAAALERYVVPVETPGAGVPRVVRTANLWPARWRIVAVEGVPFEGAVPGVEVTLPDRAAGRGHVVFEYASPLPGDLPWVWMPSVVELDATRVELLDLLRQPG